MEDIVASFLIVILFLGFSFLPTTIAFIRGHSSKWGIFVLNLLGGWTGVFWVVALIWSLSNTGQTVVVNNNVVTNG